MATGSMPVYSETDIYLVLSSIRSDLQNTTFTDVDQQKVLVSVAELTRNILDHAGQQGCVTWEVSRDVIRITVSDHGKGISDLSKVIDNVVPYPEGKGLGLGLSGTKRLMDEFEIETSEKGTRIVVAKRSSTRQRSK